MPSAQSKRISLSLVAIAVVLLASLVVFRYSPSSDSARGELLGFVPGDATSVIFIDANQLRASPFLTTLYSWAPYPAEDSEYTQFISDTGFNYERDLSQVLIAISNHGPASRTLVVAEGKFDRRKIEAYLSRTSPPVKQGSLTVFQIPGMA